MIMLHYQPATLLVFFTDSLEMENAATTPACKLCQKTEFCKQVHVKFMAAFGNLC